jgi:uncharacterized protein (DUF885 family)
MNKAKILLITLLFSTTLSAQSNDQSQFNNLIQNVNKELIPLDIPAVSLDYKVYLTSLLQSNNSAAQRQFFLETRSKLQKIDFEQLNESQQMDFKILQFEVENNLNRLELIDLLRKEKVEVEKYDELSKMPNGPKWYGYLVTKWTGTDLSLEEIMDFGLVEVERISNEIQKLNLPVSKPDLYYTKDTRLIEAKLKKKKAQIDSRVPSLFPDFKNIPTLNIEQGTNARLAQAPGYYSNNTFYYNLFDEPFDLSETDWLLIHEGSPGHHFEVTYHDQIPVSPFRNQFQYMGFIEGWAAYTENLGWEMGLYTDPYEALAKWNWDLIRSARVYLDVALNYKGWSDEQAMEFWRKYIHGKDDIGLREIARMKRWPAQVLAYKLGEYQMLAALKKEQARLGENFDFNAFHATLLNSGTMPVNLIASLFKQ